MARSVCHQVGTALRSRPQGGGNRGWRAAGAEPCGPSTVLSTVLHPLHRCGRAGTLPSTLAHCWCACGYITADAKAGVPPMVASTVIKCGVIRQKHPFFVCFVCFVVQNLLRRSRPSHPVHPMSNPFGLPMDGKRPGRYPILEVGRKHRVCYVDTLARMSELKLMENA